MKPSKPSNLCFSSGPCSKRPNWTGDVFNNIQLGRSHRAPESLKKIQDLIARSKKLLQIPDDYLIGIVAGSDTGAFELALWNFLGKVGVDVMYQEHFGKIWHTDIISQLKLTDVRTINSKYGEVPNYKEISPERDLVFTLNGTTSGVCFNNLDFISEHRTGLTLCDATSIVYSIPIDFSKLDITTYSWQKSLGGEAQHGILILSPRAVRRLKEYTPPWPLPKIFQISQKGDIIPSIFEGSTINTPSMMCVYDCLDSISWAESIGGREALFQRVQKNFTAVNDFINSNSWIENLCSNKKFQSPTSVCLRICTPEFDSKTEGEQRLFIKKIAEYISNDHAGFDFVNHKKAPPSFRIWCGPTIESTDVTALCNWISYAYHSIV